MQIQLENKTLCSQVVSFGTTFGERERERVTTTVFFTLKFITLVYEAAALFLETCCGFFCATKLHNPCLYNLSKRRTPME
jgi:hypothetical protein